MQYKITKSELKSTPYGEVRDITATDLTGNEVSGAVWAKSKDGTLFPNFSGLVTGAEFEANAWTNPTTGKVSFFAPKPSTGAKQAFGGGIKAVERKEKGIEKSQDRKEEGIKTSSTIRMAVDLAIAQKEQGELRDTPLADLILIWRAWLLQNWEIDITDTKAF